MKIHHFINVHFVIFNFLNFQFLRAHIKVRSKKINIGNAIGASGTTS